MARIRINFGPNFCGEPPCNICFRDGAEVELTNQKIREDNTARYRILQKREKPVSSLASLRCPKCNGSMVVRINRNTNQRFMGCHAFPNCRGTRNYPGGKQDLADKVAALVAKEAAKVTEFRVPTPPTEVKAVSFADLMARPVKMTEDNLTLEGDLWDSSERVYENKVQEKRK